MRIMTSVRRTINRKERAIQWVLIVRRNILESLVARYVY